MRRRSIADCSAFPRLAWSAAGMNTEELESADEQSLSELEPSMSSVSIEQESFEMPVPGLTVTHFITIADIADRQRTRPGKG